MHPAVYAAFERICGDRNIRGKVLEIGAVPNDTSLLCMHSLSSASEKLGINLDGPYTFRDFEIRQGNSNDMACFDDGCFDAVLCNAVLEHDPHFYRTLSEIKRITRSGGLIVIGVPGFGKIRLLEKIQSMLQRIPVIRNWARGSRMDTMFWATLTLKIHDAPGDYYRYSEQAVREIFLSECADVEVISVMLTPRLIGVGVKI